MPLASTSSPVLEKASQTRARGLLAHPVHFVFSGCERWRDVIDAELTPQPDQLSERLISGEECWILQTWLYLKQLGADVKLTDRFSQDAIHIAHFDTFDKLGTPSDAFLVGVRGDRSPLRCSEAVVVQSPAVSSGRNTHLIGHWPQPGLVARDPERGERIERVGFLGFGVNLESVFQSPGFRHALSALGVELVQRLAGGWHDYSDLDLVLAVRGLPKNFLITKPASKLVNAWKAGCPALLGSEPAYRAIGTPGVDYFEVDTPDEVIDTIRRLQADSELYHLVREQGRTRITEHDVEAVTRQWLELLNGPVALGFERWRRPLPARAAVLRTRRRLQKARQWLDHKLFWSLAHGTRLLRGNRSLGG